MTDHGTIIERFDQAWRVDSVNRERALEDLRFVAGDQWDEDAKNARESGTTPRPCLTINRMPQFTNSVTSGIRKSYPGVEVFGTDKESDKDIAEIYEGLIRQIEYQSKAQHVYAWGVTGAAQCGIGHWRYLTEYCNEDSFDQDILIERVDDHQSVVWDSNAKKLDRSDAKYCFITEMMSKEAFEAKYPDKSATDVPNDKKTSAGNLVWNNEKNVRIAEYWEVVEEDDGFLYELPGGELTKFVPEGEEFIRKRPVKKRKIQQYIVSGQEVLEGPHDWAGTMLPFVPVIGEEVPLDGTVVRNGIVRHAKDAQRLYNYWRSATAENIALSPKAKWLVQAEHVEGLEAFWNAAHTDNSPFLPYNPSDDNNIPTKMEPSPYPNSMWREASIAQDDMKATTGIYDAALGNKSNETSGVAIRARQSQTDDSTYTYTDNFMHSLARGGQILLDLIPKVYDSERVVRILNKEEKENFVEINTNQYDPDGQPLLVNDLSVGKYDLRVRAGQNHATAREEARESISNALSSNPALFNIIGDLYFESLDFPGADKIAERIRKTIPPQILEQSEDDEPQVEQPPDPVAEAAQRMEFADKEAEIAQKQSKTEQNLADAEQTRFETFTQAAELGLALPEEEVSSGI